MSETPRPRQPADATANETSTATTAAVAGDLSRQIERTVAREPADSVRCSHVYGSFYRCNWWTRLGVAADGQDYDWAGLLTDQIRKSRFLKVTVEAERLVVVEISPASTYTSAILSD